MRVKTRKTRKNKKLRKQKGGMEIEYPSFIVNNSITTVKNTIVVPKITLSALKLSTLIMYDPNAIKPSYIHYLITNIPNGDISKGDTIFSYAGPSPPPNTGDHHYIFTQFEQMKPYSTSIQDRSSFDINAYIQQYNLVSRVKKQFIVKS